MFIDDLIEAAAPLVSERKIVDVRAGLGYTGVLLDDGGCGLAYTFRDQLGPYCGALAEAGGLIGLSARDTALWAKDDNLLKAAIGVATINAAFNRPDAGWETGNVVTAFDVREGDTMGMVGEFHPILHRVKDKLKQCYVFELNPPEDSGLYPSESIPLYLPQCEVIVVTATSIINHTFDVIAPHLKYAREICIVGASVPLCTEVFSRYNITMLAGNVVKDADTALRIISQGGGTMSLKPATQQVLVRL